MGILFVASCQRRGKCVIWFALGYMVAGLLSAQLIDLWRWDRIFRWPHAYESATRWDGLRWFLTFWLWPLALMLAILFLLWLILREWFETYFGSLSDPDEPVESSKRKFDPKDYPPGMFR